MTGGQRLAELVGTTWHEITAPGMGFNCLRSAAEQAIIAFSQSNLLQEQQAQPVDKDHQCNANFCDSTDDAVAL